MQIQILQVADTKDSNIKALEKEYEKRLSSFSKLETLSVKASKSDNREQAQTEEEKLLTPKLNKDAAIIALDENGKTLSSTEFAEFIRKIRDEGQGKAQFIIGGSNGIHPNILNAANYRLSFSKMTFTHEMIRVFLKEQLYRAFCILAGKRYHK
ncbi:23S rRNA (pseudouridine(1915)-N(3))-methyltransferase RlmH [Candidatus Peregrinibacteria bacterium]|jgi:23S rRNA (pseudouridine1915-N3)-methyltransferase|nr:23S rRNA (pseudouridine(1915)-N(3))-methyltransferase RlmH [Candidatus Peregrinibacteria bacterium]MBT4631448.1 23S rRNA (pseudouridine(1915)-N(3))-methyltransferase RlmH [Candidatus Peregrinibacteria bacterium]MBT5516903.1 23S rRNA (pseudouridine(1915)-N(3))-methyltransferase RlmH [Candidatus Peregrinibacteria bacterium]MBT5823837.1 23S rRNA (pseudouridine(1915)-N(3))-methyltransferase RlmH [Candidatus Peregrinibacteria bacterium]